MKRGLRSLTLEAVELMNARARASYKRAPARSTQQAHRAAVRPRAPSETSECKTFIAWTRLVKFKGEPLFERVVKIANERRAGPSIAILESIGMREGFPDYDILAPAGQWGGLYLEAKKVDGGKIEPEQEAWRLKLIRFGYHAQICAGSVELIAACQWYFNAAGCVADGSFIDHTRISA